MLCYKAGNRRETPDLMACSKVMHGNCSRCGVVGESHFTRGSTASRERTEKEERRALRAEFFKKKKSYTPSKAQIRMFVDA